VDAHPESEPVWVGPLRFARTVALVDLVLVSAVGAVCLWRGWTSADEFATALAVGAGIVFALGAAPFLSMTVPGQFSRFNVAYELEVGSVAEHRATGMGRELRAFAVAFAAAAVAAAEVYAIAAIGG